MVRINYRQRKWSVGSPKNPQPRMEPIFGDFYGSPPVDPFDCSIYPDSPYCGGNPIATKPISLGFSLVRDECNIGFQLDPVIGYIKLPPVQIVRRSPNCNVPPPPSPSLSPVPFEPITRQLPALISDRCGDADFLGNRIFFWNIAYFEENYRDVVCDGNNVKEILSSAYKRTSTLLSFDWSYDAPLEEWKGVSVYGKALVETFVSDSLTNELTGETDIHSRHYKHIARFGTFIYGNSNTREVILYEGSWRGAGQEEIVERVDKVDNVEDYIFVAQRDSKAVYQEIKTNCGETGYSYVARIEQVVTACPPHQFYPPPIPPMSCCPNVRENDELLRLIAKRLGVSDYPVNVPKYITDESKGNTSIENLTRFTSYLVKQLDAVSGNYPLKIEVEDTDLTKEGNQTKKISIPNTAEALAELLSQILLIKSETSAILNTAIRSLTEIASTKQTSLITHDQVTAAAHFLNYKTKQVEKEVGFTCTPGKEKLEEFLKEGKIKIISTEYDDKQDLSDYLEPLLSMAAMYRVQNFRKLPENDAEAALRAILNRGKSMVDRAEADLKGKDSENNFDKFVEDAESGFISQPGIYDNTNPYGRPYDERPRIKEIGNTKGEET
jgi:hypothetical protein